MKYIFKKIIGKISDDGTGGPGGSFAIVAKKLQYLKFCELNGIKPEEKDKEISFDKDFEFGECFIPADENIDPFKYPLQITPYEYILKYLGNNNNETDYFEQFFGEKIKANAGFINYWNPQCLKDKNIHVYYVILDSGPAEIMLTIVNNDCLFLNKENHLRYYVNMDGSVMDCTPDEDDILFDNKEEASEYFKTQYANDLKAKFEALAKAKKEKLEQEEFEKHIESLGDGTYIGQIAGCTFYYKGKEYISPIGIRQSFPGNVIIDIKNGKVSFRNWGTPYDKWLDENK